MGLYNRTIRRCPAGMDLRGVKAKNIIKLREEETARKLEKAEKDLEELLKNKEQKANRKELQSIVREILEAIPKNTLNKKRK
jgi:hypothetical protein